MTDVALISAFTYRTMDEQRAAHPGMPFFIAPDDIPTMLRQSQRVGALYVHVLSLACAAEDEDNFKKFWERLKNRKAFLNSKEERLVILSTTASLDRVIKIWRAARRNGAAKAGGEATADKSKKQFWERFTVIKDRWHGADLSARLLKKAGIAHHDTVRFYLGYTRWEWRRLTPPVRERVLKRLAKEIANAA